MILRAFIFILLIILPTLGTGLPVKNVEKSKSQTAKDLIEFSQLARLHSKHRKAYINYLVKLFSEPQYKFLSPILLTKNKELKTKCHPALFGKEIWITNSDQSSLNFCKKNIDSASRYFLEPRNQTEWDRLRMSLKVKCLGKEDCIQFYKKLSRLNKKVIRILTRKKK